jgi:hypothetical protein
LPKKKDPATETIEAIRDGLPPGVELDEREEALLDLAARQARDVAAAEADIAERGYLVTGSRGQGMINPSVSEARQGRRPPRPVDSALDDKWGGAADGVERQAAAIRIAAS